MSDDRIAFVNVEGTVPIIAMRAEGTTRGLHACRGRRLWRKGREKEKEAKARDILLYTDLRLALECSVLGSV